MADTASAHASETRSFEAEVSRLLHLVVHSVYSEREIFLRELISNASDALDKLRYKAISGPSLLGDDGALAIRITVNQSAGTLTIADNGIGMDRAELIENLGTIARSGTRSFLDRLKDAHEGGSLIGQFGVGFYSAFMVADAITFVSRKAGSDDTWTWTSDGITNFTVAPASPDQANGLERGSRVTVKIKDDARTFLEPHEIERIVRTYSDHVLFPVELRGDDGEFRQINSASALWQRSKSSVTPEQYTEAYRSIAGAFDEPAMTIHYRAEGRQAYAVLLFVPKRSPFDLFDPERRGRIKLYVRRVFISDDAGLLPSYLRFVRGVVDSEDVPLNISREMLQNNPLVAQIRSALTTRVLTELDAFAAKDPSVYADLWKTFGAVLKEGLYEDHERREQLLKLCRFTTTAGEGLRSLAEYVAAMRPNQTDLYYLAGDSLDRLKGSPQLEAAAQRGVEVLLLTDPIDHFWTSMAAGGFDGKPFKSLSQGEADFSLVPLADGVAANEQPALETVDLVAKIKAALGDAVSDVRASKRLVSSPVCIVADGRGPDRGLNKLLAAQDRGMPTKPVLELNMGHALIRAIAARAGADEPDALDLFARLLFDQACILEGGSPADPQRFSERMTRVVLSALEAKP